MAQAAWLWALAVVLLGACAAPAQLSAESPPLPTPAPSSSPTTADHPWPPNLEGKELNFPSIDRAVTFLQTRMNTLIPLPKGLPSDAALDTTQGPGSLVLFTVAGQRSAQLRLIADHGRLSLTIEYGVALLDGCAPEESTPVQIAGQWGLLRESPGPWTELIWPATHESPQGTYGLNGTFSSEQILAMARSMAPAPMLSITDVGC